MSSIAFGRGFFWQTLWDLADNQALRKARKDPYTLAPGDEVVIPDRRIKSHPCTVDRVHSFRIKGVPERVRVQLLDDQGEPRKGQAYVLECGGSRFEGTLDAEGRLDHWISPQHTTGRLTVTAADGAEEQHEVLLGGLDPIDSVRGAQQRLINLGLYDGPCDGAWNDDLIDAVIDFQLARAIAVNGELDEPTRGALAKAHGG